MWNIRITIHCANDKTATMEKLRAKIMQDKDFMAKLTSNTALMEMVLNIILRNPNLNTFIQDMAHNRLSPEQLNKFIYTILQDPKIREALTSIYANVE